MKNLLTRYGYPQRFGFPVFLILDGNGKFCILKILSTLKKEKRYNGNTVIGFFKDWEARKHLIPHNT